jgi:putative membrane protein
LAGVLVAGVLACGEREEGETASIEVERGIAPITVADLTDPNFLYLYDQANAADSSAAAYAFPKATDQRVKLFAQMMMTDHHALRNHAHDAAADLRIALEPAPIDPIGPHARREMDALQKREAGPEFDRTYIRQEILVHQAMLDLVQEAHRLADAPQVRQLFGESIPVLGKHLKLARELDRQLQATT